MMVGPGYWPLTSKALRGTPSGAIVVLVISRWYLTVFPVVGNVVSKSVAILKPSDQQLRVEAEFVQEASAAVVELEDEVEIADLVEDGVVLAVLAEDVLQIEVLKLVDVVDDGVVQVDVEEDILELQFLEFVVL